MESTAVNLQVDNRPHKVIPQDSEEIYAHTIVVKATRIDLGTQGARPPRAIRKRRRRTQVLAHAKPQPKIQHQRHKKSSRHAPLLNIVNKIQRSYMASYLDLAVAVGGFE